MPFETSFYVAAVVKPSCIGFSSLHSLGAVSHGPDWSGGFLWRWDLIRLQRPSIRAGSTHPSPDSLCVLRRELEGL